MSQDVPAGTSLRSDGFQPPPHSGHAKFRMRVGFVFRPLPAQAAGCATIYFDSCVHYTKSGKVFPQKIFKSLFSKHLRVRAAVAENDHFRELKIKCRGNRTSLAR
jgi:hypothetical protein